MANRSVLAIQINTGFDAGTHQEIGLILENGKSVFKWSTAPVVGFYSGFLAFDSDVEWSEIVDTSRGGGIVNATTSSLRINNTNQLSLRCQELGICFTGCKFTISEKIIDTDDVVTSTTQLGMGTCGSVNWSDNDLKIMLENSLNNSRNSNVLSKSDFADEYIPATFGEFNGQISDNEISSGAFAKAVKYSSVYTLLSTKDISGIETADPSGTSFYATEKIDDLVFQIRIASPSSQLEIADADLVDIGTDLYLCVKSENSSDSDDIRLITDIEIVPYGLGNQYFHAVNVTIDKYFNDEPILYDANSEVSCFEFRRVERKYIVDNWDIKEFIAYNNESPRYNSSLVSIENDKYYEHLNCLLEISDSIITIPPRTLVASSGFDTIESFFVLPIVNSSWYDKSDSLGHYGLPSYNHKEEAGVFFQNPNTITHVETPLSDFTKITDRVYSPNADPDLETSLVRKWFELSDDTVDAAVALYFELPTIGNHVYFSNCYLGTITEISSTGGDSQDNILDLRTSLFELGKVWVDFGNDEYGFSHLSLPDNYLSISTGDKFFYNQYMNLGTRTGYQSFLIPNIRRDNYENGKSFCMVARFVNCSLAIFKCYELAIIFKSTYSLTNGLFTRVKGRVFDSTWGSRKTSTAMIENPIDIYEHICRLQNGQDHNSTIYNWGKEYDPNAMILTGSSDYGSFDHTSLDDHKDLKVARQIIEYNDGDTSDIKKTLARDFYLIGGTTGNGYETLYPLNNLISPSTTVSIRNLQDISEMIEPQARDVFAAPYINYAYDQCAGKFTKQLRVDKTWFATKPSDALFGFNGTDGDGIWDQCHDLFDRFKTIEPMPSDLTDQYWITDYDTALWKIGTMVSWMDKRRVEFSVDWNTGRLWKAGLHININFPHQTNGFDIECVIESVKFRHNRNKVTVGVVLLEGIPTNFYTTDAYQDTWTSQGTLKDWQDYYTSQDIEYQDSY